jgi:hypothetical protein
MAWAFKDAAVAGSCDADAKLALLAKAALRSKTAIDILIDSLSSEIVMPSGKRSFAHRVV